MPMSGEAVMETVRRYRATASLYRQTAAFRPLQRYSLLEQAEEWDRLAVEQLELYFMSLEDEMVDRYPAYLVPQPAARWDMRMAA